MRMMIAPTATVKTRITMIATKTRGRRTPKRATTRNRMTATNKVTMNPRVRRGTKRMKLLKMTTRNRSPKRNLRTTIARPTKRKETLCPLHRIRRRSINSRFRARQWIPKFI